MAHDISKAGIDLIKKFEGCRLDSYRDAVNVWTIGYGHTGDVKDGQRLTQAQADALLIKDLKRYVDGVNTCVKVAINQHQFDALVSFAYNLGVGALQQSTLLQEINLHHFDKAANEFGHWVHAGGKVLKGLVTRRNAERDLFITPVSDVQPSKPKAVTPKKISHTVVSGDTVSKLAAHYKTTVAAIVKLNHLDDKDEIKIGQVLKMN